MSSKTTIRKPSSKPAAKPVLATRGNLKPAEIKPLVMAARKAYDIQKNSGNLDNSETFDSWRHDQCLAAVNQPGLTACSHEDYRPLLSHFQILAGDESAAFSSAMAGGKSSDRAPAGDTREARRQAAHLIAELLANHEGPIGVGYLIWLVRGKTQRPDLHLGTDWQAGLADRCTVSQLRQILFTLSNRISAMTGRGAPKSRNKSQRSPRGKDPRLTPDQPPRF